MSTSGDGMEALIDGILDAVVPAGETVWTVREAARALRVSDSTILGLIHSGQLGTIAVHNKSFRIPRQALVEHLTRRYAPAQLVAAQQELAELNRLIKSRRAQLRQITDRIAQADGVR
ncbi:helix-turn-helix domain-containing protein [Streptosporangium saharense]|uniref:Excisionase family DNA binding protein n=1 Tax=Streptosporangium saharense TaxID=1706840 RepID=A0A7W7QK78_9ACTN|nr:helix-turn-helix domain-containing protein [Streptosporangium saharense]MBB4915062.1 excisionase family DNA binding protein [Streptosporangium saharense]